MNQFLDRLVFSAADETATRRFGAALANALPETAVIGLHGDLGAGKTLLVRSAASALSVEEQDVASPTFVLCREYQGQKKIFHLDVYRLKDANEFYDLGPEEYYCRGLVFIEWADRIADLLPTDRIDINIRITGPSSREIEVAAPRDAHPLLFASLSQELGLP